MAKNLVKILAFSIVCKNSPQIMHMNMNARFDSKVSNLSQILSKAFENKINKARVNFISLFILALNQAASVNFNKLAKVFDNKAATDSSLRRIQRFMASYKLDSNLVARVIISLLPVEPPYQLSMDRTDWKFGSLHINILVLAINYKGLAFPVIFKVLPKAGNSRTEQRIKIMQGFIGLCGSSGIESLLADREFIGQKWFEWLNSNGIHYFIRIRNNTRITIPGKGNNIKVSWLFNQQKINQKMNYHKIVLIKGEYCYLSASKVKDKTGKPELMIIASFSQSGQAIAFYKERWATESAFRALKKTGYNLEDTHLKDRERIQKLFALVIKSYAWCYKLGLRLNELKPIKIKKLGYKSVSFFRYGMDYLAKALNINDLNSIRWCFEILSCS